MSKFIIQGGKTLHGEVNITGAKNSSLILLPASILASTTSTLSNIPQIDDIDRMVDIIKSIGAKVTHKDNEIVIDPQDVNSFSPDEKLIKRLRGSIVLVGPLLAKFGKATFSQPGGCLIGARPIDDHLDVFRQMGVTIQEKNGIFHLIGKPKAGEIVLSKMSVTATENAIMASVFSPGETIIQVAAAEPEIEDLADYLNKMGAKITGAGTHTIKIVGVEKLFGAHHEIIPDRIEVGTYLMAAVATNSEITIGPMIPSHLSIVFKRLGESGAKFEIFDKEGKQYIQTKKHAMLKAISIDTRTYPGFSTDLQAQYTVLMTQAKGKSNIFETLFEGRFLFLEELSMMGAKTEVLSPHIVNIYGPTELEGTNIVSRDIRGGAALVIAGLIAKGETTIADDGFIDRGYEHIDKKLAKLGASIRRVE